MGYAPPTPQADLMGALQTGTCWLNEQVTPQNAVLVPLTGEMLATKAVSPVINVVKAGLAAYFAKKQAEQAGTSFGKSFELHQERQAFDEANSQSRSNELQLKQPVEPPANLSDASIQEATVRSFLDTIMGAVMGAGAHGMAARTAMEGRPTGVKPEATPMPSTRELVLANAREGLPNNPQEIQRKIIANAFEQAAYRAKAGEARRGETQQLAPGQKPEVDEALTRMNELKQEADRLYGQLELAKREATLAKQEQAVREGSLAAPEARGEAPVIGEPIYGENLVQPEVVGGEIKPVYQAAGEPKQGGQVSFGSEASAGGVPSARQAGHEGAFGGAEQPKGVIPQVVDIVTSKDRLALNEMRNAIRGAEEGTQQAPGAGVARATDFDLARLIDSRIRELKTGTFDPELSKIRATISPVPKTKTLTAPEVEAEPVQEWGKVKSGAPTPQGGAKLYMGLDPEEIKRSLRPAIRLMSGRLVVGEQGETHNDIIAKNKLDATQIDRRTFELNGKEFTNSREEAAPLAEAAGIKTETQPGRL